MSTSKKIVVIQAGWVFIGTHHPATKNAPAFLTDAYNIRKWGTTEGLGQIAMTGPTKETVLDPCGVVVLDNAGAVLFMLDCKT